MIIKIEERILKDIEKLNVVLKESDTYIQAVGSLIDAARIAGDAEKYQEWTEHLIRILTDPKPERIIKPKITIVDSTEIDGSGESVFTGAYRTSHDCILKCPECDHEWMEKVFHFRGGFSASSWSLSYSKCPSCEEKRVDDLKVAREKRAAERLETAGNCERCGEKCKHHTAKYCSGKCRVAACRERKKTA